MTTVRVMAFEGCPTQVAGTRSILVCPPYRKLQLGTPYPQLSLPLWPSVCASSGII